MCLLVIVSSKLWLRVDSLFIVDDMAIDTIDSQPSFVPAIWLGVLVSLSMNSDDTAVSMEMQ